MPTCHDVANFFLAQVDCDGGDLLTNLKIQKLAYYAQGLHLALYATPLFNEPIEAWTHGPVVPELYHRFKQYGSGAIEERGEVDLSQEQVDLLLEVQEVYGQFTGTKLRNMTHEEAPWKNTANGAVISHDALAMFFKTRLV